MPEAKTSKNCWPRVVWVNGNEKHLTVVTTGSHKAQERLKCRCDVEITLTHVTDIHGLTTERTWEAEITNVEYKGRLAPKEKKQSVKIKKKTKPGKHRSKARKSTKASKSSRSRSKPKKRSRVAAKPNRRHRK